MSSLVTPSAATSLAAPAKLRIDGVGKNYDEVVALEPTSLHVNEGEFLTLLGPSGSGKTTLLSIVSGLTAPSSGDVWIDGKRITHMPSAQRDIGMVFQNYALFPHLTIFENIAFPLRMRRRPAKEINEAVSAVLALVKLEHCAQRYPKALSGGQQQRIALARCFVYRPSIVLMDEPLGALDKSLREHMQTEIKRIHHEFGATILYVTHDQEEALAMSDRICLMNNARIEQLGTPSELYFQPKTVFSARFLGESNILPGMLSGKPGCWTIDDRHAGRIATRVVEDSATGRWLTDAIGGTADGATPVNWMVRPESLYLMETDASFDNTVEARMADTIFIGGVTKIVATLPNGTSILVKALTSGRSLPKRGDTVRLGWHARDTVVLPAEGHAEVHA